MDKIAEYDYCEECGDMISSEMQNENMGTDICKRCAKPDDINKDLDEAESSCQKM